VKHAQNLGEANCSTERRGIKKFQAPV